MKIMVFMFVCVCGGGGGVYDVVVCIDPHVSCITC